MKVVDPGHMYDLDWLDGDPIVVPLRRRVVQPRSLSAVDAPQPIEVDYQDQPLTENRLIFVKREGKGYPGNEGHHPGTNMQEVLRALIDRVKYLNGQVHDGRNGLVLKHLRGALLWLEDRAAGRHGRALDPHVWNIDREIELEPTCPQCGHVGHAAGKCHGDAPAVPPQPVLMAYRCDRCLGETLVRATSHYRRGCDSTNCGGTRSPMVEI